MTKRKMFVDQELELQIQDILDDIIFELERGVPSRTFLSLSELSNNIITED